MRAWLCLLLGWSIFSGELVAAGHFRVATYNLENYLLEATPGRAAKSEEARAKVRELIRATGADVVALQEVGGVAALMELRAGLKQDGCDFPFWEHVPGGDTNIQVAVLSRLPLRARRSHSNDTFLLTGRRFRTSRGIAEVDIQAGSNYCFTLLTCHLKSKRAVPLADDVEMRVEEARLLRQHIDECFERNPEVNLVVLGDFNDTCDSAAAKTIMGRGRRKLVDTRPAERRDPTPAEAERRITWTHHYAKTDTYTRIDFLLLSSGMVKEWVANETFVLDVPDWGRASDHRPVVATFAAEDK